MVLSSRRAQPHSFPRVTSTAFFPAPRFTGAKLLPISEASSPKFIGFKSLPYRFCPQHFIRPSLKTAHSTGSIIPPESPLLPVTSATAVRELPRSMGATSSTPFRSAVFSFPFLPKSSFPQHLTSLLIKIAQWPLLPDDISMALSSSPKSTYVHEAPSFEFLEFANCPYPDQPQHLTTSSTLSVVTMAQPAE